MTGGGIVISETGDYAGLVAFFIGNGLEFSAEDEVPTDIVKSWKAVEVSAGTGDEPGPGRLVCGADGCGAGSGAGRLVGGCVLAKREGRFICDGIATDPSVRGMRIGERLLSVMTDAARALGAAELYLVARAPGFFAKNGFEPVPRDGAPTFFECFSCPQYGNGCNPEVMRLNL